MDVNEMFRSVVEEYPILREMWSRVNEVYSSLTMEYVSTTNNSCSSEVEESHQFARHFRGPNRKETKGYRDADGKYHRGAEQRKTHNEKRRLSRLLKSCQKGLQRVRQMEEQLAEKELYFRQNKGFIAQVGTPEAIDYLRSKDLNYINIPGINLTDNTAQLNSDHKRDIKVHYVQAKSVEEVHKQRNRKQSTLKKAICSYSLQTIECLDGGNCRKLVEQMILKKAASEHFTALKIGTMYLNQTSHTCNFGTLDAFRNLQTKSKWERGLIPSPATLQRFYDDLCAGVEDFAKPEFIGNNMVLLKLQPLLERLIIEMGYEQCGLPISQHEQNPELWQTLRPIQLVLTYDGAELTKTQSMLIQALKLANPELITRFREHRQSIGRKPVKMEPKTPAELDVMAREASAAADRVQSELDEEDAAAMDRAIQLLRECSDLEEHAEALADEIVNNDNIEEAADALAEVYCLAEDDDDLENIEKGNDDFDEMMMNEIPEQSSSSSDTTVTVCADVSAELPPGGECINSIEFADDGKDHFDFASGFQSADLCVVTGFCNGDDNSKNGKALNGKFFPEAEKFRRHPLIHSGNDMVYKVDMMSVMDKKAFWTCCGIGGAMHACHYPCLYCSVTNQSHQYPAWFKCGFCLRHYRDHPEQECWHHQELLRDEIKELQGIIVDEDKLFSILEKPKSTVRKEELVTFISERGISSLNRTQLSRLHVPQLKELCNAWFDDNVKVNSTNIESIDINIIERNLRARFRTEAARQARIAELGLTNDDANKLKRTLLRHTIAYADRLAAARRVPEDAVLKEIDSAMPCTLHTEMRTGEDGTSHLLTTAIKDNPYLTIAEKNLRYDKVEKFINAVLAGCVTKKDPVPSQEVFDVIIDREDNNEGNHDQEDYFDESDCHSSFRLKPLVEGSAIQFKISCVRLQKLLVYSDKLVDTAFADDAQPPPPLAEEPPTKRAKTANQLEKRRRLEEEHAAKVQYAQNAARLQIQFKEFFNRYKGIMKTLRVYTDFSDEQIDELQKDIDKCCELYRNMFGSRLTNYWHDLQSGHFRYFLLKYRNLYRHSNIGFESLMGHIRSYYFRRTQRGGGKMSTTRAMAKYLQHQIANKISIVSSLGQHERMQQLVDLGKKRKKERMLLRRVFS